MLEVPSAKRSELDAILNEDAVSRQSITLKDARGFGLERAALILVLEGEEAILARVEALVRGLDGRVPPEASAIYDAYREESDAAAGGMGFVFG